MSETKGYEVLCQAFVAEGVDTMFALLGDANMYWGAMQVLRERPGTFRRSKTIESVMDDM